MRYTKFIGLAVVLVALAVTLNALAFSTAKVTNSAKLSIAATGSAAVAISSTGGADLTATTTNNYLELTINDKMQPNSTYKFANALTVTNKATSGSLTLTGYQVTAPANVTAKLYVSGKGTEMGAAGTDDTLSNTSSVSYDLEITVGTGATVGDNQAMSIVINAKQP